MKIVAASANKPFCFTLKIRVDVRNTGITWGDFDLFDQQNARALDMTYVITPEKGLTLQSMFVGPGSDKFTLIRLNLNRMSIFPDGSLRRQCRIPWPVWGG